MNNDRQNIKGKNAKKIRRFRNSSELFELIIAFEDCTLPPERCTRPALLAVAFWYLYMNPLPEARQLIWDGIRRYNFEHQIFTKSENNMREVLTSNWFVETLNYLKLHKGNFYLVDLVNEMLDLSQTKSKEIADSTTQILPTGNLGLFISTIGKGDLSKTKIDRRTSEFI
jgi:hypothetical protein